MKVFQSRRMGGLSPNIIAECCTDVTVVNAVKGGDQQAAIEFLASLGPLVMLATEYNHNVAKQKSQSTAAGGHAPERSLQSPVSVAADGGGGGQAAGRVPTNVSTNSAALFSSR